MAKYNNIYRAHSQQVSSFILSEVETDFSEICNDRLEERCEKVSNKFDDFIENLVGEKIDIDNKKFSKYINLKADVMDTYFELGMKAGAILAISLELSDLKQ